MLQRACFRDDYDDAVGECLDVSRMRSRYDRNHADRCLYFFLRLPAVQCTVAPQGGRLLRVLFLRLGAVPADSADTCWVLLRPDCYKSSPVMKVGMQYRQGIAQALAAAALFGFSTPLAKALTGEISPVLLAGLLYASSGLGLTLWLLWRRFAGYVSSEAPLTRRDAPWLAGAVLFGGVLGPILLMWGLTQTAASTASLLLNLESVLTAVLAWVVFRENVDVRVFLGMLAIIAGSVLLSWSHAMTTEVPWGALAIAGACLCWAIDNNFTRPVSGGDPVQIAAIKGGIAGTINIAIAFSLGMRLPQVLPLIATGVLGFVGYGLSLVLFVLALRHLGTARTGAYFSTAPFVGATVALLLYPEHPSLSFWLAGALMASGVWLHISERHKHEHVHPVLEHDHSHEHDAHHQHTHGDAWDGKAPHAHLHVHIALKHDHPHFPDLHHRHTH